MTCMTSVGFGNVAAETDNEKIFTICMMIIAGMVFFLFFSLLNIKKKKKKWIHNKFFLVNFSFFSSLLNIKKKKKMNPQ